MSFTKSQSEAIAARGNVLVVAGAGTGKTRTLVERCLSCLLDEKPPASLDEILMVTFTDAAAAEMRHRIRERLEEKLMDHPDRLRWSEQLALFDTAHIGTLHGFCLQLVRQHFYELELDPQLTVMPEEEARLLADETLEEILQEHYAGKDAEAEAVQELIQAQGRGSDQPIRALVFKLHHYTQTLRDPEAWFAEQMAMFDSPEPKQWQVWLIEGVGDWRTRWLPALKLILNPKAIEAAQALDKMPAKPSRKDCAKVLQFIHELDHDWPHGKKTAWRKPMQDFFDEAIFLNTLAPVTDGNDPLAEDWDWVRVQMAALMKLTQEFAAAFGESKRELGVVDFHDLEQHSLHLLWDRKTKQPTGVAREWRKKLRFVFVDEYQDINEAQDAILKALSREGDDANRFLVGDVKQSIYRFRLADPHIFQNYAHTWRGELGKSIPLADNFRSRESILNFVNSVFGTIMRREIGSVVYDEDARLHFGDPENRGPLSITENPSPRVELHLRLKVGGEIDAEAEANKGFAEMASLEESAKEARLTGLRLRELKNTAHLIWDEHTKAMRPVKWSDMAVLLRSPSRKAENYAKEFARLGIPLTVARGGFYDSMEIADLISLLQLLDNPLQDLPLLAVLHSPLVGMSLDDLATVRLAVPRGHIWTALQRYHELQPEHSGWQKADTFLKNFAAWRRLARQISLSRCLETVLNETRYGAWLQTQSRGEQRHANVQRLLTLARQFDQFQRQGLFRFLHFIDAQKAAETEPDVAPVSSDNSVSLMSIHQSKGLEFPVVVVADLGKLFNTSDLKAEIILDQKYGLCPQVKPPHTGQRYPSLPYWLARQRQKEEMLGEELRLLYVAMTRARDTLILTGNLSAKTFAKRWQEQAEVTAASLLAARNYLDWLGAWSASPAGALVLAEAGKNAYWHWTIYDGLDQRLLDDPNQPVVAATSNSISVPDDNALQKLRQRLSWKYPHVAAIHQPAKTSVTALRKLFAAEADDETTPLFRFQTQGRKRTLSGKLSATEIGLAHHTFLQRVALEQTDNVAGLKSEAKRLVTERALSSEENAQLDFNALAAFWQSDLGKKIRAQAKYVHRELPFTARFTPTELSGDTKAADGLFDDDFVIVQGVADLVVLLPKEMWLVDFKTDQFDTAQLPEKIRLYAPQLKYYAEALTRIYRRPVTQSYLHFLAIQHSESLPFDVA